MEGAEWWVGLGSVLTSLGVGLGWLGKWYLDYRRQDTSEKLELKKSDLTERRTDEGIEFQRLERLLDIGSEERKALTLEVERLRTTEMECQVRLARAETRLSFTEKQLDKLEAFVHGPLSSTAATTTLTTDEQGNIRQADPGATVIFHYEVHELLGRNVSDLIPAQYRKKHHDGLEKLKELGTIDAWSQIVSGWGLTKHGREIPVIINVSAFRGDDGKLMFTAGVSRRI